MRLPLALAALLALNASVLAAAPAVSSNAAQKTAVLNVVAQSDTSNSGLNFNGASKGGKTFTVPLGWTVTLKFTNAGAMPHSVVLARAGAPALSYDTDAAAFAGAATKEPLQGVVKADTFTFKANKAGQYVLICGVPGHGMGGQYVKFEVSTSAKAASFK
ncbi:sulfocyanin-like copper-binding protein [Deinococcus sp. NW-56]|uniref:sulfocyanin-like copper-binding protein n=1 Tax=Deinococcus sp. NW-56 TaxID=2080419 RepID=UPI000CF4693E|nr:sulfocyanin-like copper-binding protein [Deinococcus sp. NW-56]